MYWWIKFHYGKQIVFYHSYILFIRNYYSNDTLYNLLAFFRIDEIVEACAIDYSWRQPYYVPFDSNLFCLVAFFLVDWSKFLKQ